MWIDFMKVALKSTPKDTMAEPAGMMTVRIDKKTGLLSRDGDKDTLFEVFRKQYAPTQKTPLLHNMDDSDAESDPIF